MLTGCLCRPVVSPPSALTMLTPSPVQQNLAPSIDARKVEKPYLDKKTTKNIPFNSTEGKAVAQQYTFAAHPLNVEPVVVPWGWTWCTHQKQLEEMVEDKLHQLHDTVGSSCIMFGSSQLRGWLMRSAHPSVYSSNSELIDDTRFPFTTQRCLLIWGFHNNMDQTSAEGFASKRYMELFGKSVTGRDNDFTSGGQLIGNSLNIILVVCMVLCVLNTSLRKTSNRRELHAISCSKPTGNKTLEDT